MRYLFLHKYLLLASISILSAPVKVEAGRVPDFVDWFSGCSPPKSMSSAPFKDKKNTFKFREDGRNVIEKLKFFDKNVHSLVLQGGRFIVNQDADHPEALRSLSIWDTERKLMYTKEESFGKRGKKVVYVDPQSDVSYWKKRGKWYVVAPYAFGYTKESYNNRPSLEERLEDLFQQRLLNYLSKSYIISSHGRNDFTLKKTQGLFFKKILETHNVSSLQDIHHFLLDRETEDYMAYLYDGEEVPPLWKSLGFLSLVVGAGIVDGINVQKLVYLN